MNYNAIQSVQQKLNGTKMIKKNKKINQNIIDTSVNSILILPSNFGLGTVRDPRFLRL